MKILMLILIALIYSENSMAGYAIRANELVEICDTAPDLCNAFFGGYIMGLDSGTMIDISSSSNLSAPTMKNLFIFHMKNNPADGDELAEMVVIKSLVWNKKATVKKKYMRHV